MKRANVLVLIVSVVLSLAASGALRAQDYPTGTASQPGPSVTTSTISGTLVSSSPESIVVKTDAGVESTFTVDAGTALPESMTPGDRVGVEYHMLDGGAYLASRVSLSEGSGATARTGASGSDSALPASAENSDAAGGTGSPASSGSEGELPRTSSPLPLIAGIGVLAILAALGLRAMFRVQQPRT